MGPMKPYSTDLRERAVLSVESDECTIPQAAQRFGVSEPSVERWLARWRATGSCAPRPHAGGVARKLAAAEDAIRVALKAQPDATLSELCETVEDKTDIVASPSMMCRELAQLKLPLKKSRSMPASGTRPR
jgi:transposase